MKVLVGITYYHPHLSGLTIYVERLSRALVARGHEVTVLTSRFDKALPREETIEGVRVVRVPVALRVSKGVIMPGYGMAANRLVRENDVISLHLPQFDAWGLALRGRVLRRPSVITYHCDLQLPTGLKNRFIDQVTYGANYVAGMAAQRVVAYTRDYAEHSRLVSRFKRKTVIIPPPVVMPAPTEAAVTAFRAEHSLGDGPLIGMAARFAAEKGVEVLLDAAPALIQRFPNLRILFAGPYTDIAGEEAYRSRLFPRIEALGERWKFLGALNPETEMPAFLGASDCLVVSSVNMTESFGLVQVEAMLCGTPVVASDLPGVRQPVLTTGMGEITPIGNGDALAAAITRILDNPLRYVRPRGEIEAIYDVERTVSMYERLFERQIAGARGGAPE